MPSGVRASGVPFLGLSSTHETIIILIRTEAERGLSKRNRLGRLQLSLCFPLTSLTLVCFVSRMTGKRIKKTRCQSWHYAPTGGLLICSDDAERQPPCYRLASRSTLNAAYRHHHRFAP